MSHFSHAIALRLQAYRKTRARAIAVKNPGDLNASGPFDVGNGTVLQGNIQPNPGTRDSIAMELRLASQFSPWRDSNTNATGRPNPASSLLNPENCVSLRAK